VDGKLVLVLDAKPDARTLYSLLIDANKPEYFIRRDGTTYPARADEIMAILAAPEVDRYGGIPGHR
jgi:hypothetical protein